MEGDTNSSLSHYEYPDSQYRNVILHQVSLEIILERQMVTTIVEWTPLTDSPHTILLTQPTWPSTWNIMVPMLVSPHHLGQLHDQCLVDAVVSYLPIPN